MLRPEFVNRNEQRARSKRERRRLSLRNKSSYIAEQAFTLRENLFSALSVRFAHAMIFPGADPVQEIIRMSDQNPALPDYSVRPVRKG